MVVETTKITIRFVPQIWIRDYATSIDVDFPCEAQIDAVHISGIEPYTYEADNLRYLDEAPTEWREWSGPFEIEWDDDGERG